MPPLTLENAGALVPGGAMAADIEEERRMLQQKPAQKNPEQLVEVIRAFYYQGKAVPVLDEKKNPNRVVLPKLFAIELRAANKVKFVEEEPAPAAPAATAKTPEPGKKEK